MVVSPHDATDQLHRKKDREHGMLNEQVFHDGINDAFARYVCDEAVRILHITEEACYMPSAAVIFNILRCGIRHVNRMCGYKSWRLDILQKTRDVG